MQFPRRVNGMRITRADGFLRRVAVAGALLLMPFWVTAEAQELIANKELPDAAITRNDARLFFTLRLQRWLNDEPVKVFVLPDDHPVHRSFSKSILGLFPYQLRRVWDRQLFSGTGQAPIIVADEAEMIRRVASTPNAIGYVAKRPDDERVRVLEVR
jgi:ABC-type phosphate transport system substrate-binding protein